MEEKTEGRFTQTFLSRFRRFLPLTTTPKLNPTVYGPWCASTAPTSIYIYIYIYNPFFAEPYPESRDASSNWSPPKSQQVLFLFRHERGRVQIKTRLQTRLSITGNKTRAGVRLIFSNNGNYARAHRFDSVSVGHG